MFSFFHALFGWACILGSAAKEEMKPTNKHAFTSQELDQMLRQMTGKSKKEANKVLESYCKY